MERKEMNVDKGLNEMTLSELLNIMADNRALTASLVCDGFRINVEITPEEEEEEEGDYED